VSTGHDELDDAATGSAGLVADVDARSFADPALALACVDLAPRLRRTADILLAGLIPSRPVADTEPTGAG